MIFHACIHTYIRKYTSCKLQSYVSPAVKPARTFTNRRGSLSRKSAVQRALFSNYDYLFLFRFFFSLFLSPSLSFSVPIDDDTNSPRYHNVWLTDSTKSADQKCTSAAKRNPYCRIDKLCNSTRILCIDRDNDMSIDFEFSHECARGDLIQPSLTFLHLAWSFAT